MAILKSTREFKAPGAGKDHASAVRGGGRDPGVRRPGSGLGRPTTRSIFFLLFFLSSFLLFFLSSFLSFSFSFFHCQHCPNHLVVTHSGRITCSTSDVCFSCSLCVSVSFFFTPCARHVRTHNTLSFERVPVFYHS